MFDTCVLLLLNVRLFRHVEMPCVYSDYSIDPSSTVGKKGFEFENRKLGLVL